MPTQNLNEAEKEIESLKGQIHHLAEKKKIEKDKATKENDTGNEIVHFVNHVIENDENCRHYTGFPSVQLLHDIYQYLHPGPNRENVVMYNPTTNSQPKDLNETRGRKRAVTPFKSYILMLCCCGQNFSILHLAWLEVSYYTHLANQGSGSEVQTRINGFEVS